MAKVPAAADGAISRGSVEALAPPSEPASRGLCCVCLATVFLVRLEVSVLTLVIPLIADEFGCSLELAAWVHFAPNFASTMLAPSVGKLADLWGAGAVWHRAVFVLVASTWFAAWSPSLLLLLLARIGTGIAQSGIFSPGLALMARGASPARRGVINSALMTCDTLGSSTGMIAGGLLLEHVRWRWIFLAPAPVMTLSWLLSFLVVPRERRGASGGTLGEGAQKEMTAAGGIGGFDWLGALLFAGASFCLLFALNRGNDVGWGSPLVIALAAMMLVLSLALLRVEERVAQPVLPLWLFAGRERVLMLFVLSLASAGYSSTFLLVPIFMVEAMSMSPGDISRLLFPRPIAATLASVLMTRLLAKGRVRRISLARAGSAVLLASYLLLNVVCLVPAGGLFYALTVVQLVMQAVGHFTTTLSSNALLMSMLPEDQLANATAMQKVIGSSFGLLVSTASLSLIHAVGSEATRESYRLPWLSLVGLSWAAAAATCLAPAGIGQAYSALEAAGAEAEATEAPPEPPATTPAAAAAAGGSGGGEGAGARPPGAAAAVAAASLVGRPAAEEEPEGAESVLLHCRAGEGAATADAPPRRSARPRPARAGGDASPC